ncbi:unnamed protein product [Tilletia controversa]|uniref:Uncharacterized protein n=1 Tax=Tilletia caries TaxID=13290 RepID=A0ABN7IVD2_9BASI|nr:unnamed protein product [Tilletia caries]CAD6978371.1 unnamed protein product [Tilletia controversa]CAD7061160.1 unnamed protein product [Tilletia caries]
MSSLTSIAAVVLGPLILRKGLEFFRGGLRSSISGLRSVPSPLSGRALPAELLLLALTAALVAYHAWALVDIVFFPATNRVTDVFLASDTPVNAASILLRERVAKYASGLFERLTDTYVPAGAAVEELFRRLTSYEGRKIYLIVGEEPLLYCVFCVKPNDYKLYTLPLRLAAYGAHFVFFGILTLGDPTLSLINTTLPHFGGPSASSAAAAAAEAQKQGQQLALVPAYYQPSRAAWRRSVLLLLLSGLSAELFALHSFADWHVNILLARHVLFLLMSIIIYFVPTAPEQVSVQTSAGSAPSALQGAIHALNSTTTTLQFTLAHLQALTLSTDVVANDSGLRALREAKAVQDSIEAAANASPVLLSPTVAAADGAPSGDTATSPHTPNGTSAAQPTTTTISASTSVDSIASAEAEADSARQRQRQAGLVRLAKRAGIDVDTVRREAREAAESVLRDTEKRAREAERRTAETRARNAASSGV